MRLYDVSTLSKKSFKEFKKLNKGIKIDYKTFYDIGLQLNNFSVDHIIETGKTYKASHGIGRFDMYRFKPNYTKGNRPIDFKATKELWDRDPQAKEDKKKVYHFNDHTDGYICRIRWKNNKTIPLYSFWEFETSRYASRLTNKKLRSTRDLYQKYRLK